MLQGVLFGVLGGAEGGLAPQAALGAATALNHPGQERFQCTPGCGMEAQSMAGQWGEGRKAASPGGTPRCHRVRAGKGPQAPGNAAEVTRIPEQPELHLVSKPNRKTLPGCEDVVQTSPSPASTAERGHWRLPPASPRFLAGFPAIRMQKLLAP